VRFSPPHFCKPWKPAVSFIGLAKTSYTATTLSASHLPAVFPAWRGGIENMRNEGIRNEEFGTEKFMGGDLRFLAKCAIKLKC
jgi:hypothetical protein